MDNDIVDAADAADAAASARVVFDIRRLSSEQLAKLGVSQIAYVKTIRLNGASAFAIHAADGTPMAVTEDRDTAFAAIRQHEMLPAMVH